MFKMDKYQEEAWTPDLGGEFEDLQLKIKFVTSEEQKRILAENATQVDGEDGKPEFRVDLIKSVLGSTRLTLDRVIGWRNTETKFSPASRDKLLPLLFEDATGITLEGKEKPANLEQYIVWFSTTRDNFLADSVST